MYKKIIGIFILILFTIGCGASFDGVYPGKIKNPPHIHKYIHIDPNFNDIERETIRRSIEEWSSSTNGFVRWTLKDWKDIPNPTDSSTCSKQVFIMKMSSQDSVILYIEKSINYNIAGYALSNSDDDCSLESIYIVMDVIHTRRVLRLVVLHEVGHNLGLHHNHQVSIMNPDAIYNLDGLTHTDIVNFCNARGCDTAHL